MKKLLLLAFLGLLLGAGAWKLQNPEAALTDLSEQALSAGNRLQNSALTLTGLQSTPDNSVVTGQPSTDSANANTGSLTSPSTGEAAQGGVDQATQASNTVELGTLDSRLERLLSRFNEQSIDQQKIQDLQSSADTLANEVSSFRNRAEQRQATLNDELNRLTGAYDVLNARQDALSAERPLNTDTSDASANTNETLSSKQTLEVQQLTAEIGAKITAMESQLDAVNHDAGNIDELAQQLESANALVTALQNEGSLEPSKTLSKTPSSIGSQDANTVVTPSPSSNTANISSQRTKAEAPSLIHDTVQYKIYFDLNSVQISDAAARVLNSFITQEKNRTTGVSIFGFADPVGSAAYNRELAMQRATNVRSYLIQNGLDLTKIRALNGLDEMAAASVIPRNANAAQQRVVVLFAAQP